MIYRLIWGVIAFGMLQLSACTAGDQDFITQLEGKTWMLTTYSYLEMLTAATRYELEGGALSIFTDFNSVLTFERQTELRDET